MAALVLCGFWALTLAASDDPARTVAPSQKNVADFTQVLSPFVKLYKLLSNPIG